MTPRRKLALFVLTALFVANCVRLFWQDCACALQDSFDTGWIIRTGLFTLHSGVPTRDIFSWTFPDRAFVAYQWLFEVLAAGLYSQGGLCLVGLFACIVSATLYFFLLPRIWMRNGIPVVIPYAVLCLVLTPHWFNARPQLFSYFLLLGFVGLLERYRLKGRAADLIWIPPLMVLWVNLHAFWSIGLLLVFIFWCCDLERRARQKSSLLSPIALALLASLCCVMLNPYGAKLVPYIWSFVDGSQYMEMYEAMPSITSPSAVFVLSFLGLGWWIMIARRGAIPVEGWLTVGVATLAALAVRRYESVAVILMWPYLGMALASIDWSFLACQKHEDSAFNETALHWKAESTHLVAAASLACLIWYLVCPSEAAARALYCQDSLSVLELTRSYLRPSDRLFCDPTTGDWLIFLGASPVYADTRYDMYPKEFVHNAFACVYGAPGSLHYIKRSGISHVLVRDDFSQINKLLAESPDWSLLADDGHLSLWGPVTAEESDRMRQHRLTDRQLRSAQLPYEIVERTIQRRCGKYLVMSRQLSSRGKPDEALPYLEKAVSLLPGSKILRNELESVRTRKGT